MAWIVSQKHIKKLVLKIKLILKAVCLFIYCFYFEQTHLSLSGTTLLFAYIYLKTFFLLGICLVSLRNRFHVEAVNKQDLIKFQLFQY